MYQKFGIMLLLIVCSLGSSLVFVLLNRHKKEERKHVFWFFSFIFVWNFFIVSAMKYYLGYHKENLIESFWNAQAATLLHYGVPLLLISIALPFLMHFLFRESFGQIVRFFDSALFFLLSFAFFFVRKINNKVYCIAFLCAFVLTTAAIGFLRKKDVECIYESGVKEGIQKALPVLLYWFITVVIFTPNELYLNNASDFPMSYWYFMGKLVLAGVLVGALLLVCMLVYLTKKQFELYLIGLFSLLTAGYIQGLFLNGNLEILDGTASNLWNAPKIIGNLVLWGILIGAIVVFYLRKSQMIWKVIKAVSIWVILIQAVSLGVMIATSKDTAPKSDMVFTTEGMLEVGAQNNVIVFILDKFDEQYLNEILEENPEFLAPFNDFTHYTNATSEFSPTYDSIPFLLSGADFVEESTVDYVEYAYENENLLTQIHDAGYDVGVYTNKRYVPETMQEKISNYKEGVPRTCSTSDLFSLMTQCSRYKMAPFAAKQYYMYDTSDIELLVVSDEIVNIENDLPFYHQLTEEGLHISQNDSQGTFRFIHMHGGHPPYTMTEEFQYLEYDSRRDEHWGSGMSQRKGALKIVYEYLRQLKELGKYEDALIMITADHGFTEVLSDENGTMTSISYPILFVKEPGETHDEMAVSSAPVSHADMLATIQKKLGILVTEPTLKEIGEQEERIRYMKVSTPGEFEKYEINGEAGRIEDWRLLHRSKKNLESTH